MHCRSMKHANMQVSSLYTLQTYGQGLNWWAVIALWLARLKIKPVKLWHASHVNYQYYYTSSSLSLFWLAESIRWIFEISARDVITADAKIMPRTLKVTGNQVMYDCGAWCSKGNHVKFAHFVLLAVSEGAKTWLITPIIDNLDYSGYHKNLIQ